MYTVAAKEQSARRHGLGVSPKGSACSPGAFYMGPDCQRCFCQANKVKICSSPLTCKTDDEKPSIYDQIRVFNPFKLSELHNVDTAAKCKPGAVYRSDCKKCLCTESGSLLCEKQLCPNYEVTYKHQAEEINGKPCKEGDKMKQECMECFCRNSTFACDVKKNCLASIQTLGSKKKKCIPGQKFPNLPNRPPCKCTAEGERVCSSSLVLLGEPDKRVLPFRKEFLDAKSGKKCRRGVTYIKGCNKCICSEKRLLRCTSKTCVRHDEILSLFRRTRLPGRLRLPRREKTVRPPNPAERLTKESSSGSSAKDSEEQSGTNKLRPHRLGKTVLPRTYTEERTRTPFFDENFFDSSEEIGDRTETNRPHRPRLLEKTVRPKIASSAEESQSETKRPRLLEKTVRPMIDSSADKTNDEIGSKPSRPHRLREKTVRPQLGSSAEDATSSKNPSKPHQLLGETVRLIISSSAEESKDVTRNRSRGPHRLREKTVRPPLGPSAEKETGMKNPRKPNRLLEKTVKPMIASSAEESQDETRNKPRGPHRLREKTVRPQLGSSVEDETGMKNPRKPHRLQEKTVRPIISSSAEESEDETRNRPRGPHRLREKTVRPQLGSSAEDETGMKNPRKPHRLQEKTVRPIISSSAEESEDETRNRPRGPHRLREKTVRPQLGSSVEDETGMKNPRTPLRLLEKTVRPIVASNDEESHEVTRSRFRGPHRLREKTVRPRKLTHKAKEFDESFLNGKKCEPGVVYRRECNKCTCTEERHLQCTSMGCPNKSSNIKLTHALPKHE
ncbi:uncharacterized protein LOC125237941 isoform X2 [Leguminivora glycinivorella]|uniref:uncharacterized protein LOC125237941 isoform X2 n=1 Tax=Leguminivora glycinivorella TaxID=1035111 RepID=UPI00200F60D9|nr:uncharacterized protein LOC125237941 isoform X2 [Leguminivora glycinivorella]